MVTIAGIFAIAIGGYGRRREVVPAREMRERGKCEVRGRCFVPASGATHDLALLEGEECYFGVGSNGHFEICAYIRSSFP